MVRECKRCPYIDDEYKFPLAATINGKRYYRHVCKSCYGEQKKKQKAKSKKFLDDIRKNVECVRCGNKDWRVIEWHHVDPKEKEFNIGDARQLSFGPKRLLKELKKCTPLCANCHRIVEYEIRHNI